jgi:hypothetical protein
MTRGILSSLPAWLQHHTAKELGMWELSAAAIAQVRQITLA